MLYILQILPQFSNISVTLGHAGRPFVLKCRVVNLACLLVSSVYKFVFACILFSLWKSLLFLLIQSLERHKWEHCKQININSVKKSKVHIWREGFLVWTWYGKHHSDFQPYHGSQIIRNIRSSLQKLRSKQCPKCNSSYFN